MSFCSISIDGQDIPVNFSHCIASDGAAGGYDVVYSTDDDGPPNSFEVAYDDSPLPVTSSFEIDHDDYTLIDEPTNFDSPDYAINQEPTNFDKTTRTSSSCADSSERQAEPTSGRSRVLYLFLCFISIFAIASFAFFPNSADFDVRAQLQAHEDFVSFTSAEQQRAAQASYHNRNITDGNLRFRPEDIPPDNTDFNARASAALQENFTLTADMTEQPADFSLFDDVPHAQMCGPFHLPTLGGGCATFRALANDYEEIDISPLQKAMSSAASAPCAYENDQSTPAWAEAACLLFSVIYLFSLPAAICYVWIHKRGASIWRSTRRLLRRKFPSHRSSDWPRTGLFPSLRFRLRHTAKALTRGGVLKHKVRSLFLHQQPRIRAP
jgi:hypothetical protein